MPITGIEKLYVAINSKDDAAALTYGIPEYYEGVKEINIKPKQNTEKLYAENKLWDQATIFDSADVEINLTDLSSLQRSKILGQTLATEGGVYASDTDLAPYVAVLYKATIKGGFRYGVIYKGAFGLPDEDIKGQEGKVAFQTPKITATFQPTIHNGMWEYHVDSTDPSCPVDIETKWFTTVTVPTPKAIA